MLSLIKLRHSWRLGLLLFLVSSSTVATIANASPFDQGQQHLQMAIGSGSLLNDNYIILGIGYGYYLQNGLELGIDFDLWLDGDPSIYQVTPEIKYVLPVKSQIKPYVGTFYRRNFIEGFDDRDAYGYRAGVYWLTRGGVYIGYGFKQSTLKNCNETIYFDCEEVYSELSVMVSIN